DPACNDPSSIEAINILNTKAQRKIDVRLLRLQQVERFENVRRAVPFHFHARPRDVLTFTPRRSNKCVRVQSELLEKLPIVLFDLAKSCFRITHEIHFVYHDDEVLDSKHRSEERRVGEG